MQYTTQFCKLLNHPNFDQTDANISSSMFGQIINTLSVPTSILGSFLRWRCFSTIDSAEGDIPLLVQR